MVNTLFAICTVSRNIQNNVLLEMLAKYEIFDALLFIFSRNELVEFQGKACKNFCEKNIPPPHWQTLCREH
jgi:hypothetical protein